MTRKVDWEERKDINRKVLKELIFKLNEWSGVLKEKIHIKIDGTTFSFNKGKDVAEIIEYLRELLKQKPPVNPIACKY